MKKFVALLLGMLLALTCGLSLVGCSNPEEPTAKSEVSSFVSIDINPYLELTLDQNDKVMSVRGANEDGNVLLFDLKLEGMKVEDAVKMLTDLAFEYGYINENNTVINTIVTSIDDENADKIRDKINNKITVSYGNCDIQIGEEDAYSLLRKWEKFTEEYPELKNVIPAETFRLALSASETGVITLEEAMTLDKKELMKIVEEGHRETKDVVTKEAEKEYVKAKAEIEQWKSLLLDTAYTKYYVEKEDQTMWYGATYQLYNTLAIGLENASKILNAKKDVSHEKISYMDYMDEMSAIENILGVDDLLDAADKEGNLTIEKIETYANKIIKNKNSDVDTDALETALTDLEEKLGGGNVYDIDDAGILNQIVKNANVLINGGDLFEDQLYEINSFVGIKGFEEYFNLDFGNEFDAWVSEFEIYLSNVAKAFDGKVPTSKELHELSKTAKESAKEMKHIIDSDLTKEQKRQIEEERKTFETIFQVYQGTLESYIDNQIISAKDIIGALRGELNG